MKQHPYRREFMTTMSPEVRALFDAPNVAHLATVRRDGSPISMAVWVTLDGDRIVVCTGAETAKAKNTRRDPRIALSITDHQNPYKTAMIRGRVVEHYPDDGVRVMDRISMKYTGKPFRFRGSDRIVMVIEPEYVRYSELPFEHSPAQHQATDRESKP